MAKFTEVNDRIAEGVVKGYRKVEGAFVGSYKKIEDGFVGAFLAKDGETAGQAKERMAREQEELREKQAERMRRQQERMAAHAAPVVPGRVDKV